MRPPPPGGSNVKCSPPRRVGGCALRAPSCTGAPAGRPRNGECAKGFGMCLTPVFGPSIGKHELACARWAQLCFCPGGTGAPLGGPRSTGAKVQVLGAMRKLVGARKGPYTPESGAQQPFGGPLHAEAPQKVVPPQKKKHALIGGLGPQSKGPFRGTSKRTNVHVPTTRGGDTKGPPQTGSRWAI